MKTLKKTLCLVLAMVMVLGLCAVSGSAKTLKYTDTKDFTDVNYKEAVDVLDGIGILEGYADGTFLPKQDVTRAEAAKIIAYLAMGGAEEADALRATKAPFEDVAQGHWAAGYIQYLTGEGIINGNGDGKFNPNGKVTNLQFAKMLLCVIGYGKNGEYTGSEWAINVAKDALNYGIFKNALGRADNTNASREACALYAFNALHLCKVTYSALLGNYIQNIRFAQNAESNKAHTLAYDFDIEVKHQEKDDAFMRYNGGYYWVMNVRNAKGPGSKTKVISEVYGNDYLVGTFTQPVTATEIYNLTGKGTATVYVDGVKMGDPRIDKGYNNVIAGTGYGVETYVYKIDKEIRICCVNVWLARVDGVLKETAYNYAKTKLTVAYENGNLKNWIYDTEEFAKGDYVLLTYSKKVENREQLGIQQVWKAPTVEAKLTQLTNVNGEYKRATAGNTNYTEAFMDYVVDGKRASAMRTTDVNGSTYTFYLSSNNINDELYLKGIDTVTSANANKYVYVAQFGQKTVSTDLNTYYNLTADVYYTDGSHEVLLIDSLEVWEELNDAVEELEEIKALVNSGDIEKLANVKLSGILNWDRDVNNNIETIKAEILKIEKALTDLISYLERYANGFVTSTNNEYIKALNTYYTGLYILQKGKTADNKILPLEAFSLTSKVDDDAVGAPTEKAPTPVYNKISALCEGNYTSDPDEGIHNPIFSDADTYFFYVSGTYGRKDFKVTVYQGTNAAPTTTGKDAEGNCTQGLTSFYAVKGANGRYYAEAALVRGQFKDAVADGTTVYYYNGKSYTKDNLDGTFTVTYELYKAGEKVNEISYTFDSWKDAQAQLTWDNELTWHWVIDGYFEQSDGSYISGLKEALKTDKEGNYVATKYGSLYYTPYMLVELVDGDTLYANYLDVFPTTPYYNGYALTADTKVVVINDVTYKDEWYGIGGIGYQHVTDVNSIKDYAALGGQLVICFSYDANRNVDTIYIVNSVEDMGEGYNGNTRP